MTTVEHDMQLDSHRDADADRMIEALEPRHGPLFSVPGYTPADRRAILRYLFSRRPRKLPPSSRSRLIALYDPMADRRRRFPDGLRWCLNVYVGCDHACGYCYVNGYLGRNVAAGPHAKRAFLTQLDRDLRDIEALGVPVVPIHLSNSTDPLQQRLEAEYGHLQAAMSGIARRRSCFGPFVILTKNPARLVKGPYLELLGGLAPATVQVSCAFWRDEARRFYEPDAPSVASRLRAMRALVKAGVDVELRLDPLFPASWAGEQLGVHPPLEHYGLPEAQTLQDLAGLVSAARDAGVRRVVTSPLKVPIASAGAQAKRWFAVLYRDANGGLRREQRGGSWRLPERYRRLLVHTVVDLCRSQGMAGSHCRHDLLQRR